MVESLQIFELFLERPRLLVFLTQFFTELLLEVRADKVVFRLEPRV
jgi:hypothetical protein